MNLYEFVGNEPVGRTDYLGLWGTGVHLYVTRRLAVEAGFPEEAAGVVGQADEAVDGKTTLGLGGKSWNPVWGDQGYHFDRNQGRGKDTRIQHYEEHLNAARAACSKTKDDPIAAAVELGTALHPYQDWVAHGAYAIYDDGGVWSAHNSMSPQKPKWGAAWTYPDNAELDAVGEPDGRAAGRAMHLIVTKAGSLREYAIYEPGRKRIQKTQTMTAKTLKEFRDYVEQNASCECKRYFGVK